MPKEDFTIERRSSDKLSATSLSTRIVRSYRRVSVEHTQHSHLASPNATHHHTPLSTSVSSIPHFPIPDMKHKQTTIQSFHFSVQLIPFAQSLCIPFNNLHVGSPLDLSSLKNVHHRNPLLTQNDKLSIAHPVAKSLDTHIVAGSPQHVAPRLLYSPRPLCFLANTLHSFHPHHQFLRITDAFDSAALVLHAALFSSRSPSSCLPITASILTQTTSSPPTSSEDPIESRIINTPKRDTHFTSAGPTQPSLRTSAFSFKVQLIHPIHQRGNTTNEQI
ncbi:hypothetical protein BLNAU_5996 [Blattamonas nauphoetae]|uniref:Uncharacterized protein n=1 Tax=Blattamonas nauphoetae TaxID=2049346 RepID=A0ABQ9Y5F7_9EUKA|nr:hypothetical protein BLNAU_5996 [Blattamonas nauphoetae]